MKGSDVGFLPFVHYRTFGVCSLLDDLCPQYPQLVGLVDDLHTTTNVII